MNTRKPVVAGQFYSENNNGCVNEIEDCLAEADFKADLPQHIKGGIVPHAGWTFSGDLAAAVFSAISKTNTDVDTFVIFGAAHRYMGQNAGLYDKGKWQTPLGDIEVDEELASEFLNIENVDADQQCHISEHSIEVEVPFIQYLFPEAKIVPIMIPPAKTAVQIGRDVGKAIAAITDKKIVCIASSDLTHYGPNYGFCPHGSGRKGIQWANDVNDAEFIERAVTMDSSQLLVKAEENMSACGPGAAAALVAAMSELGVKKGVLLGHTNSSDIMIKKFGRSSDDSVGYAGIVF